MTEKLLQFIWQFQYFNRNSISTTQNQPLQIVFPGSINYNEGPDFNNARIKINNIEWIGNVELHLLSSHWHQHNHSVNKNYNNVILHVVWQHDEHIFNSNNEIIPTLELQPLVSIIMLKQYEKLMLAKTFIPCENYLPVLNSVGWIAWKERMLAERLEQKSITIISLLNSYNNHWEEVFWISIARSFGMKVNADAFEQIALSLPVSLLAKHKNNIHQIEAMLFGQAGFLDDNSLNEYAKLLQKEYVFLSKKYSITKAVIQPLQLRMRPNNFPTIRLAQLAALIYNSSHLFSKIKTATTLKEVFAFFNIAASDYWNEHYTLLDESSLFKTKAVGKNLIQNIIINTVAPVFFAYSIIRKENALKDKAVEWLTQLSPEENTITKQWSEHNVENESAFDSQALIHLKNNYCDYKKCLDCAVGSKILSTNTTS